MLNYDDLDDGRVIAAANSPYSGPQSQVIVIDEERRRSRPIADGADGFALLPGTTDVLVWLVSADERAEIVRVPVPPR